MPTEPNLQPPLDRMLGRWHVRVGPWVDGQWDLASATEANIEAIQQGRMLRENGRYPGPDAVFEPETIHSFDPYRHVFRSAVLEETAGLMDIYEGSLEGGRLILTNEKSGTFYKQPDGGAIKFRFTYEFGDDDTFTLTIHQSPATESDWQPFFRFEYERAGALASDET